MFGFYAFAAPYFAQGPGEEILGPVDLHFEGAGERVIEGAGSSHTTLRFDGAADTIVDGSGAAISRVPGEGSRR